MSRAGRYAPRAGTLASTVCIALAFPPVEWWPLIWVGLAPWLAGLGRCRSLGEALWQGFWLNLLLGFTAVFWIAYAAPRYLGVSLLAGVFALCLHALVHQLQLPLFAGAWWAARRAAPPRSFAGLCGLALLYTGIDWATPKLFQDTFGLMLHGSPALRQLAAFGGVHLLSFLVLLVNLGWVALAHALASGPKAGTARKRAIALRAAWMLAPVAAGYALGAAELARVARAIAAPQRVLRVGVVQGDVGEELRQRWAAGDADAARAGLAAYLRATRKLLGAPTEPELVVWPETSFPGIFRKPENDAQLALNVAFDRAIASFGTPLIFGAYDREDRTDRRVLRNALYLVEPFPGQARHELSPMQVYHKSILFPIGETLPLIDEATARRWLPGAAHLAPGEDARVFALTLRDGGTLRIGPAICYEDLFASHTRELARQRAQLLVNVSNDGWFGDYGAARGHLIAASFRSVETGLPQVRATNSGYSALILPDGALRDVTRYGASEAMVLAVPLIAPRSTLRTRLGDWFGPLSLAGGLLALVWPRRAPADGSPGSDENAARPPDLQATASPR